jgi:hypothetical protein
MNKIINFYYSYPLPEGGVEKVGSYPPTPQEGLCNYLLINKSPLGETGKGVIKF